MRGELLCVRKAVSVKPGGPGSAAHRPHQSFLTFRGERAAPSSVPPAAVARRERRGSRQCLHTHNPHPAVETRFLSGGTPPRRRTSRVHWRYQIPPRPCPRQGASSALPPCGGAAPHPSPPCQPSAGPCRSGRNQTPPLRPACGAARHSTARLGTARLCSPSPLSARRSLLREAGGAAAVRDAEGLRAPSEAGTGSSPGAQPPRLLKTETLRLRRSLCFPFPSPARLASLHVLSSRGASARPHGRLQRRQGQNGVEERR